MTFVWSSLWQFNGQVEIHLPGIFTNRQITYVMFIEIRVNFQFISSHRALKWIQHRALRNASCCEHCGDLFL